MNCTAGKRLWLSVAFAVVMTMVMPIYATYKMATKCIRHGEE